MNKFAQYCKQQLFAKFCIKSDNKLKYLTWWWLPRLLVVNNLTQGFLTRGARTVPRGCENSFLESYMLPVTWIKIKLQWFCYLSNSRRGCENWLVIWKGCYKKKVKNHWSNNFNATQQCDRKCFYKKHITNRH